MKILGIESSCDETAAAIVEKKEHNIKVLSNIVSSQINIHKKWGGVVPEVAAREHVLNILPVINEALEKAKIKKVEASKKIDAIAIATGPGLITSLMVGIETAKSLAFTWKIPIIPIHHIEGHIYANFIEKKENKNNFPALILTVSGGHTMLVFMKNHLKYQVVGETRDDAAGEAFDKAAKLMNIGYPGGPIISQEANKWLGVKKEKTIILPRPMMDSPNFDFSFSGLKTALLYSIQKNKKWKDNISEYCHEYQQAIIDVLIYKTIKAAKKYKVKNIMLAGGVSANTELRKQLVNNIEENLPGVKIWIPDLKYTTDNAAMIAAAGTFHFEKNKINSWNKIRVDCNLDL